METIIKSRTKKAETLQFAGQLISFNNSLKLFHWSVTGPGSYAKHIALDQAIGDLTSITDRIVETTFASNDKINITVPETRTPDDIVRHAQNFAEYVKSSRSLFPHEFQQAILDDYQEAIQQLLYRLIRLE